MPTEQYECIAVVKLKYKDKEYDITQNHGTNYTDLDAYYIWEDGNYACDCNRSTFIREKYGNDVCPQLNCGDEIDLVFINVEFKPILDRQKSL